MKLVREHILFEKFSEESDPIDDLEIGSKHLVKKWIDKNRNNFRVYDFEVNNCRGITLNREEIIINDDLSIDVYGWLDVSGEYASDLPYYIRLNHIYGDFACSFSTDKYLEQMPKQVDGYIRYYMKPYPNDVELIKEKIRSVCKVGKSIDIIY